MGENRSSGRRTRKAISSKFNEMRKGFEVGCGGRK